MAVYRHGKTYWYDFTLNGKRHNATTQARNKRIAEDIERSIRNNLLKADHGMAPPRVTPVFKAFANGKFLDHVRVHSKEKARTIQYYEEKIRRLLEYPPLADARLKDILPSLIEDYVQVRAKAGRKIATINRELAALRHALRKAEEWSLLDRAPKIRLLPGECLTRQWQHIHIEPAHSAQYGYIAITEGKTKNAKRNVPLTARSRELLLNRQKFHGDQEWVFPGQRKGKSLTISGVDNLHSDARAETLTEEGDAAFPGEFVVYSLRHTFGTRLGESGADPYVIMKLMGHSSIVISQKYVHPTPEHVERAMGRKEAMDKLMRGELEEVPSDSPTSTLKSR